MILVPLFEPVMQQIRRECSDLQTNST